MFEQMRGSQTYSNINVNVYSTRVVRVTHLGGSARVPLYGTNSCRIVDLNNPTRKRVTVSVSWVYQGRPLTESLDGVIYFKK